MKNTQKSVTAGERTQNFLSLEESQMLEGIYDLDGQVCFMSADDLLADMSARVDSGCVEDWVKFYELRRAEGSKRVDEWQDSEKEKFENRCYELGVDELVGREQIEEAKRDLFDSRDVVEDIGWYAGTDSLGEFLADSWYAELKDEHDAIASYRAELESLLADDKYAQYLDAYSSADILDLTAKNIQPSAIAEEIKKLEATEAQEKAEANEYNNLVS